MGERIRSFEGILALTICAAPAFAAPTPTTRIVAQSWQTMPGGEGNTYHQIQPVQIDELGRVSFISGMIDLNNRGHRIVYRTDDATGEIIAQTGNLIPGGQTIFIEFNSPHRISQSGNIVFNGTFNWNPVFGNEGIYVNNGGPLDTVAQGQSPSPIPGVNYVNVPDKFTPNDAGQVAFHYLHDFQFRTYVWDNGQVREIAGPNTTPPPIDGFEMILEDLVGFGNDGFVTLKALWRDANNNARQAVYQTNGQSSRVLAKAQDPTLNSDYVLRMTDVLSPSTNEGGQIAYRDGNNAIIRSSVSGSYSIAEKFAPLPTGGFGIFEGFYEKTVINNKGEVLFQANIAIPGEIIPGIGLFVGTPDAVQKVAYTGDPAPDGNGVITYARTQLRYAFNDHGQVAFTTDLLDTVGGNTDDKGIFFFDPDLGVLSVARKGAPMSGSTIGNLFLMSEADGFSSLNNRGEVAYWYVLENGSTGAAVWTIPSPGTVTVCVFCTLSGMRRRHRA